MKLGRILYGLKDVALILHDLITNSFWKADLKEIQSSSCVFTLDITTVTCSVHDILIFSEHNTETIDMEERFGKDFTIKLLVELI